MTIVKNHQRFVALGLLGASVALSGCITTGSFDASKSFADTYAAWNDEGDASLVGDDNAPTGTVSYSGGFAVEQDESYYPSTQAPRNAGEPLATVAPDADTNYIVGQLDVEVAFDDETAQFEASNLKHVTSPYSFFFGPDLDQAKTGGNASAPLGGFSEGDITIVDSFDGTLTGTGSVQVDEDDGDIFVNGYANGSLELGSGADTQALYGGLEVDMALYEGPNGQFLLGDADLYLDPAKVIYPKAEGAAPITGEYEGAAYAEEQ